MLVVNREEDGDRSPLMVEGCEHLDTERPI